MTNLLDGPCTISAAITFLMTLARRTVVSTFQFFTVFVILCLTRKRLFDISINMELKAAVSLERVLVDIFIIGLGV